MATFGEWFVKLLAKLVLRQKLNADNMSHGQGKPQNGQGNVRKKSGNFVRAHGWTPWWSFVGYRTGAFWDLWNWSNKTVCMPLFTTLDPVVIIGGTTLTWWHIMMEMLHYWPFMKGPVMQIFNIFFCKPKQAVEWWVTDVFFVVCPNKLLNSEFMVLWDTMLLMWCHILILIFVLDLTLNQNHIDQFWVSWLSFQVHKLTLN